MAVVAQFPHITDHRVEPGGFKTPAEDLELIDGAAFQVIHNGNAGRPGPAGFLPKPAHRRNPGIKQLAGAGAVAGRKGAVSRRETLCVVQLAIFVHCAGAVGIEFTERIAAGGFIVEKVDTGHRDKARTAAGVEDKVLRPGVKAEEGAVAGVGKIGVDHLFKNAVQDLHIGRQAVKIGRRQQLGGKAGAHILAVVDCGRSFHIGDNRVKIPAQRGGVRLGQGAVFGREGRHGGFHRAHTSRSVFLRAASSARGSSRRRASEVESRLFAWAISQAISSATGRP